MAEIVPLQPSHAAALVTLAQDAYPSSFALSVEEVESTLRAAQDGFCFGIFEEGQLTGYMMCWLDFSQVEGREQEPVILLDDIVVQGSSRRHFFGLLRALRRGIVARGVTDLAIEGTHRAEAEALFNSHPRVVAVLGYQLAACHHYVGEREGEPLCWARYEPMAKEG